MRIDFNVLGVLQRALLPNPSNRSQNQASNSLLIPLLNDSFASVMNEAGGHRNVV